MFLQRLLRGAIGIAAIVAMPLVQRKKESGRNTGTPPNPLTKVGLVSG